MKVLVKRFDQEMQIEEIDESMKSFKEIVGGEIEIPFLSYEFSYRNIQVLINENGKVDNLKPTIVITHDGQALEVLNGQVIFCSVRNGEYEDLDNVQISFILGSLIKNGAETNNGTYLDVIDL